MIPTKHSPEYQQRILTEARIAIDSPNSDVDQVRNLRHQQMYLESRIHRLHALARTPHACENFRQAALTGIHDTKRQEEICRHKETDMNKTLWHEVHNLTGLISKLKEIQHCPAVEEQCYELIEGLRRRLVLYEEEARHGVSTHQVVDLDVSGCEEIPPPLHFPRKHHRRVGSREIDANYPAEPIL